MSKWAQFVGEDAAETFLAGTNRLGIASLLTPVWGILLVAETQWKVLVLALATLAFGIALAIRGLRTRKHSACLVVLIELHREPDHRPGLRRIPSFVVL